VAHFPNGASEFLNTGALFDEAGKAIADIQQKVAHPEQR
jgi:hypothetical protein